MATWKQHQEQWLHNRDFLYSIVQRDDCPDWLATISFYTALHARTYRGAKFFLNHNYVLSPAGFVWRQPAGEFILPNRWV